MTARALVYAYGCGRPISGWEHVQAEHERCTILWDQLVALEHAIEQQTLMRARDDDPQLACIGEQIATLTNQLKDDAEASDVRSARRELYREQRERLNRWRKDHRDVLREFESRRQLAVKVARQQTDAWWPNYNRVLQSYETGRAVARQFGRRLRPYDVERDDGVIAYQIQRTASGLGAAPHELIDGTVGALQISMFPSPGRRSHVCEMRVDADGNTVRLPVWLHRPLPHDCRVKSAQLIWRRNGKRTIYRLCLTITRDMAAIASAPAQPTAILFSWTEQGGGLQIMSAHDRCWALPARWLAGMRSLTEKSAIFTDSIKTACERFDLPRISYLDLFDQLQGKWDTLPQELRHWYRETRRQWNYITGLRRSLLGQRREHYRRIARELTQVCAAIQLPELNLMQLAKERHDDNSMRSMAAIHTLRMEVIHQATKAGAPVFDASGRVLNADRDQQSSAWKRRKRGKAERSQM
jgi:hypothetical protein